MDLQTTIIGMVLIALCIVPFVLINKKKKAKQEALVKQLAAQAITSGCSITRHDLWHNTVIGIDDSAKCLFFFRKTKYGEVQKQAHLAGISNAYIDGTGNAIDKLELVLVHNNSNEPDTVLEFYNSNTFMQINTELALVKKWQGIVEENLIK
ncbi:hypothetical protein [uncultured Flavobacterium sp.]|uniref:hypothetical protein n=1 Tax=uncultured Flavobacterium sp. TaxID=165435 RepID=UPI0025FC904B|nr:hypothetical protein [uncultured Flavobacterium sp.]